MLIKHSERFIKINYIITRQKWTHSHVSTCETHHICSKTQHPLYKQRFHIVLPFHSPGLAPVIDHERQAYHINENGFSAYSQRFDRTFGFYQNLAAIQVCHMLNTK